MVDIGMEAFLPGSQIDNKRIKNLDEFLKKGKVALVFYRSADW